jgi:hypothetical protein
MRKMAALKSTKELKETIRHEIRHSNGPYYKRKSGSSASKSWLVQSSVIQLAKQFARDSVQIWFFNSSARNLAPKLRRQLRAYRSVWAQKFDCLNRTDAPGRGQTSTCEVSGSSISPLHVAGPVRQFFSLEFRLQLLLRYYHSVLHTADRCLASNRSRDSLLSIYFFACKALRQDRLWQEANLIYGSSERTRTA